MADQNVYFLQIKIQFYNCFQLFRNNSVWLILFPNIFDFSLSNSLKWKLSAGTIPFPF